MEDADGALEVAVADAGALLVRLEKYQRGAADEALALRRAVLEVGDAARRLHRHQRLDADASGRLLTRARGLGAELQALLAAIRGAPEYRAAVAAHAAADRAALTAALVAVFSGLSVVADPPPLFHAVAWLRRGRPRPPAEVAADVVNVRDAGLAADGDDLAPGVDPALPAVSLAPAPPSGEPLVLRFAAGAVPAPCCRLDATGDHLVHTPALREPFTVRLRVELDQDERLEETPVDYPPYRRALRAALAAEGFAVEDG